MIDNLRKYKDFIISYDLLTNKNYKIKDKLRLYLKVDIDKMRKYSYILTGDSIQELNNQISELFTDYLELKTTIQEILLKRDNNHINKSQLKLF